MFDILTDEWAHPGTAGAPVVTTDITDLTEARVEPLVSELHKHGIDSLLLSCSGEYPGGETLRQLLTAMKKRFMLAYIDMSIIEKHVGWSDADLCLYNPMLASHTLRISPAGEALGTMEEKVLSAELLLENGSVRDSKNADSEAELPSYDVILTSTGDGTLDILCPEAGELLCNACDAFYAELGGEFKGTFVGLVTDRLASFEEDRCLWSYDMEEDFMSLGGSPSMLAALAMGSDDKRLTKEACRIYRKTASRRLDSSFCTPLSLWCGSHSLAFAGEVPLSLLATCGRRFTLPIVSRSFAPETSKSDLGFMSTVKCFADTARGEGFTGCAYRCQSCDADSIMKESLMFYVSSGAIMILPQMFSCPEAIAEAGLERDDMKKMLRRMKRMSMLGVSCNGTGGCAVLYEDGFIPFAGAEKLLSDGYDFAFVPVPQIMERGHVHDGELLIDKYSYTTLLVEPRVRLAPMEIKKIGEVPVHGGEMYRGASFGDYMKKHGTSTAVKGDKDQQLYRYDTTKCGVPFRLVLNTHNEPITSSVPTLGDGAVYRLDWDTGKAVPLQLRIGEAGAYVRLRLMPWEAAVIIQNKEEIPVFEESSSSVCEIVSLRPGENEATLNYGSIASAAIEIDLAGPTPVSVIVNGHKVGRIPCVPYTLDVAQYLTEDNKIIITGEPKGSCLRITVPET